VFIPDPAQLPVNEQVEITFDDPTPEPSNEPAADATPEPTPTEPAIEPTPTAEPITVPDVPRLGPLVTPTPTPEPTEEPTATPEPEDEGEEEEAPDNDAPQGSGGGSGFFIWPVQGRISSYFGPSHPLGIDIDLYNDPNASIVAARGGTVVFAGGDPCCSYGLYVIVEHENGVSTLYAHLSEILVSEGEVVSQGERIGRGGRTGYATGNHLHFEIRVNGNVVDPLRYLP
jgi:murein DD-endopeptidase MepM/ murein hydrolase activator NlpD